MDVFLAAAPEQPRIPLILAGKLALAALLLWAVAVHVDVSRLVTAADHASTRPLLLAVLLLFPNLFLQFAKWRLLLRRSNISIRTSDIAVSLFVGFAFGLVTPARLGEFGGRAFSVRGADRAVLASLTAVDKFASLLVTILAGTACSAMLIALAREGGTFLYSAVLPGMLCLACLCVAFITRKRFMALLGRLFARSSRWSARFTRLRAAPRVLVTADYVRLVSLSAMFYVVFILQFTLLVSAFGAAPSWAVVCAAGTVMLVKTIVPPVTFGELGIREGAAVFVFTAIGAPASAALAASLILFALNVLLPALAGAAILAVSAAQRGLDP